MPKKRQHLPIIKALHKKYPNANVGFNEKANKIIACADKIRVMHSLKKFCDKWGEEIGVGDMVKWTVKSTIGKIQSIEKDYVWTEHGRWHWTRIEKC